MLDIYVYINLPHFKNISLFVLVNSSGKALINLHAVPLDCQMQIAAQYSSLPFFFSIINPPVSDVKENTWSSFNMKLFLFYNI